MGLYQTHVLVGAVLLTGIGKTCRCMGGKQRSAHRSCNSSMPSAHTHSDARLPTQSHTYKYRPIPSMLCMLQHQFMYYYCLVPLIPQNAECAEVVFVLCK